MCFFTAIDWNFFANQLMAWSTAVLALGVVFAAAQYFLQRTSNQVVESGHLIDAWNEDELWEARSRVDNVRELEPNRAKANQYYRRITGLGRYRRFRSLDVAANDFIEEHARLAERMEIYIRKHAANEAINN